MDKLLAVRRSDDDLRTAYMLYVQLSNFEKALGYSEELLTRNPQRNDVALLSLRMLYSLGRYSELTIRIERRLPLTIKPEIRSELYYLRAMTQTASDARLADIKRALSEFGGNVQALLESARIYEKNGDFRRALVVLRQVYAINPDVPDLESWIGRLETVQ